jgi:formylglycine-generating enzyme required for sulfatase activity
MKRMLTSCVGLTVLLGLALGLGAQEGGGGQRPAGAPKPGEVRKNPKDGAEMVWIPGGEFEMGSDQKEIDKIWRKFGWPADWKQYAQNESPKHRVSVEGFWLYKYEVTVAQYRQFCQATGRTMPPAPDWGWQDNHPVVNVDWRDAKAYCDWAGVRLPTEAEWEYAARGGRGYLFPWGNDLPGRGDRVGNVADEALQKGDPELVEAIRKVQPSWRIMEGYDDGYVYAAPVGSFEPNPYGVHDLAGNVWEWLSSIYKSYPYNAEDGRENIDKIDNNEWRVLRGGSWLLSPDCARAAYRRRFYPDGRNRGYGFRGAASRQNL